MCAQYIILLLSSHFLLLIMDGTKSLEGAKTTKKMTEDYVMCGSIDESPKSWDFGCVIVLEVVVVFF